MDRTPQYFARLAAGAWDALGAGRECFEIDGRTVHVHRFGDQIHLQFHDAVGSGPAALPHPVEGIPVSTATITAETVPPVSTSERMALLLRARAAGQRAYDRIATASGTARFWLVETYRAEGVFGVLRGLGRLAGMFGRWVLRSLGATGSAAAAGGLISTGTGRQLLSAVVGTPLRLIGRLLAKGWELTIRGLNHLGTPGRTAARLLQSVEADVTDRLVVPLVERWNAVVSPRLDLNSATMRWTRRGTSATAATWLLLNAGPLGALTALVIGVGIVLDVVGTGDYQQVSAAKPNTVKGTATVIGPRGGEHEAAATITVVGPDLPADSVVTAVTPADAPVVTPPSRDARREAARAGRSKSR